MSWGGISWYTDNKAVWARLLPWAVSERTLNGVSDVSAHMSGKPSSHSTLHYEIRPPSWEHVACSYCIVTADKAPGCRLGVKLLSAWSH